MSLTISQKLPLSLAYADKSGAAAVAPAGIPAWSLSDATLGSLVVAEDGQSAMLTALALGSVIVTAINGDLSDSMQIDIVAGPAVSMKIIAGAVQDA